ncbi:MAG TPA: deoxynucleoside kinase [Chitinophagaceae bacterium]|jgi:deoxyadenosine/deoxycytidine kinase|nr:deoxynucleoside kinase [Chitinophagaceae bacterium]
MQYSFLTVEGNIGAGKTTLARMLAEHFKSRLILEEFAENPFLPRFYKDPKQYAFPLELFFLAERYKQLKDLQRNRDMFNPGIVSDYIFTKSLLFARVTLPEEEFRLYQRLFDMITPQLLRPDLLIYLHTPVSKLRENIQKRNRSYEQDISGDYLFRIQETYMEYIKQHSTPTLVIDNTEADFEHRPEQFEAILAALEQDYTPGRHFMKLS